MFKTTSFWESVYGKESRACTSFSGVGSSTWSESTVVSESSVCKLRSVDAESSTFSESSAGTESLADNELSVSSLSHNPRG